MSTTFNTKEHLSFKEGAKKVEAALKETGVNIRSRIFTSRDKEAVHLANLLHVENIPDGFKKWQLPIVMESSQLFISIGQPDVEVPKHSHDEGDGIRFIMSGSIYYNDKELSAGDWMFIPKGKPYSMKVGPFGATMCYCYCCSCAGSINLNKKGLVFTDDYIR